MISFIDEFEKELINVGITILLPYEGDPLAVTCNQYHCSKMIKPVEFVEYLRTKIQNNQIQFLPLKLPGKCLVEQLHRKGKIYIRYIEDNVVMSDDREGRYDVVIRI